MAFWLQLRLLLWKNFTLRKRQWWRLVIEILWPLFLFIILMLVRMRGLKTNHHECYFEEKAMPSAGLLSFAQSFICTYNNTCHRSLWQEGRRLQNYNQSVFDNSLSDLESALEASIDNQTKADAIGRVIKDMQTLFGLYAKVRDGKLQPPYGGFSLGKLGDLFMNSGRPLLASLAASNISVPSSAMNALLGASLNMDAITPGSIADLLRKPKDNLCDINITKQFIKNVSSNDLVTILLSICSPSNLTLGAPWGNLAQLAAGQLNNTALATQVNSFLVANGLASLGWSDWGLFLDILNSLGANLAQSPTLQAVYRDVSDIAKEFLASLPSGNKTNGSSLENSLGYLGLASRLVCGRNLSLSAFASGGDATRFDELRDQLQEKESDELKYKYDNSTSQECNALMESWERSKGIRFLWGQVKPFIRGKILFTPDTPASRKVIEVVNASFAPFTDIMGFAQNVSTNYSVQLRSFLLSPQLQMGLRDFFTGDSAAALLAAAADRLNYTQNQTEVWRTTLQNYFQGNFSTIWSEALDQLDHLLHNVTTYLDCFEINKFESAASEKDLEVRGLSLIETNQLWAGIVFQDFVKDQTTIPKLFTYKLRIDADKVDSTKRIEDRLTRKGPRRRPGIDLKYLYYGFGYLQDMIEHAVIFLHTGRNTTSLPGITLQQMPYPCYIEDRFIIAIARTFPLFMTLAWVYSASMIIKSIVHEKETRLKETMRVMGLNNGVHWISWFIDSFCVMFVSCLLLTIILVHGNILENSAPSLVFCFMLSYTVATIMLSCLVSTFFSRANVAAAAGGIIFFILYLPYSFMVVWEESLESTTKILTCLISNIAFGFGCAYFSHYEESGLGAQWDNVWVSPLQGDSFSMAGCMGMLLIDSLIYAILMWYVEAVFPGEFGVPKPFYFFLTPSYWTGRGARVPQFDPDIRLSERSKQTEAEPTHLTLGVSVQHLHKVYANGKVAVEDLNLNFYEGQITSFLGHNGAGKTTTISILTGLFPPSAGTAKIYNLDITRDMDQIRESLGTCPQHNVLFDLLTVYEHLWFFARLKSQPEAGLSEQIEQMILDLGIPHKRDEMSKNLSGGMQRKLSIACAFVGGSKVVVLDEPTAGVDPYSRRAIWDLLIKYKQGRTIILTTHFMDEADLLGDRIAIINGGRLVCCGSSLFLKSLYGVGYYLTLVKSTKDSEVMEENLNIISVKSSDQTVDDEAVAAAAADDSSSGSEDRGLAPEDEEDEGISDVSTKDTIINPSDSNARFPAYPLTKFIQRHVPGASLVEEIGQEIVFVLPVEANKEASMKQFESLFHDLDANLRRLHITTYGLSDTTLEEIFLKVASNEKDGEIVRGGAANRIRSSLGVEFRKKGRHFLKSRIGESSDPLPQSDTEVPLDEVVDNQVLTQSSNPNSTPVTRSTGKPLILKHILALEIKRFHHSRRNKKGFVCEIVLPALFVCLAMAFTLILPPLIGEPPLNISPWLYPAKAGPNYMFFSNDLSQGLQTDWPARYIEELLSGNGLGTKCIGDNKSKCDLESLKGARASLKYPANTTIDDLYNPPCSCAVGTQQCPADAFGPNPPSIVMPTHDYLINMTARNISQWLLKTRDLYYKRRYGGFEFGVRNPLAKKNMSMLVDIFERLSRATNMGNQRITPFIRDTLFNYVDSQLDPNQFDNIRVWFNNKGWAASVAYMNAVNNLILRASLKKAEEDDFDSFLDLDGDTAAKYDGSQYGINLISHPMNYTETQLDKELIRQIGISLLHAICIIFAMSFVPASFVVFHIEERVSKIKHLHFVSGVKPGTYWTAALLWDLVLYTASATLCIFIFLIFNAKAYVSKDNLPALILLLLLYGWAVVPLMYPASFVFSIPSSAFVTLACANLFIGIITTVTTFVLENFDDAELKSIGSVLRVVFLVLFPQYCLGRGLMDMATEENLNSAIAKFGLESVRNRFAFAFLGKYMFAMLVQGTVFFIATLAIQAEIWAKWSCSNKDDSADRYAEQEGDDHVDVDEEDLTMDEDVRRERRRVLSSSAGAARQMAKEEADVLQVRNLVKRYNRQRSGRLAVNRLTFGVGRAECFGLLGVNGAGKTTTFKMLTGDTTVTDGEALVNGFSILQQMDQVRQSLGYCPQFDALDPLLTGREHLRLYARLRGLDEASVARVAEWGLKKLGLVAYSDVCAGTYSGGNKRKLSTAIALIGNPSVVFLDEPTSGMDPGARRFLWNSILDMVKGGQSVVLTSHSMEECEALCSRLGIMVNGQFKCLGSIQHLKNRFGSGYTLTIICQEGKTEQTRAAVESLLPHGELKEEHHTQLKYQLPVLHTKLPVVFRHMEDCRGQGLLEDYSLTQTTLDEVFIRFASDQTELLEEEAKPPSLGAKVLRTLRARL